MFGLGITFFSAICIYLMGVATVLAVIWYWFNIQESELENSYRKHSLHETKLPDALLELIQEKDSYKRRETCVALNLVLQFFFQERRYDLDITSWLTNLLTQEFSELLKHRTLSKIINKMEIQHLNLGNNFPVLKSVTPLNVQFVKDSTLLKNIEVNVEVEYTGGFQIIIDAITKLSKKAVVKIKVVRLSGKACLELSRYPFTHWSFSFYEEPESEFEVESSVLGRQIPRFKTIIINQLRNLIKRKHTLPYYKLRFAPLIKKTPKLPGSVLSTQTKEDVIIPTGMLYVTLLKCSRLQPCLVGSSLFFSVTLSEVPLICAYETSVGIWIVQDILVTKPHSSPVGVLLRNADDNSQIIETVSGKSVASVAGLRKNDIILAVNNIPFSSGSQAAKLFAPSSTSSFRKSQTSHDLCIRIKRLIYTDHKRCSVDPGMMDISYSIVEENTATSKSQLSSPIPLEEDSIDSAYFTGEPVDKIQKGMESLGDKSSLFSHHSRSFGKLNTSGPSTPESSRSSSPELKPRSLNTSLPEEKPWTELQSDRCVASLPIQIPSNSKLDDALFYQDPRNSSSSPQTSKAGTPTGGLQEFISHSLPLGAAVLKMDSKSQSKKSSNKNRPLIKHFETSPVEGTCDPIIGNDFKFQLDEECKFLNICVWSKMNYHDLDRHSVGNEKFHTAKEVINKLRKRETKESERDNEKKSWTKDQNSRVPTIPETPNPMTGHPDCVLVGLVNIPVHELIGATKLNTEGSVTKVFPMNPADPSCPEMTDHPLLPHKGFDTNLCYGDVMISVVHQQCDKTTTQHKSSDKASLGNVHGTGEEECLTDTTLSDEEDLGGNQDEWKEEREHVFKRTHFNSATQCSFCKKKIWLKDAYQCSECGIICHKKCMLRCQQATVCDFGGLRYREIKDPNLKEEIKSMPEIIMTMDSQIMREEGKVPHTMPSPRHTLSSFLSHISSPSSGSLKRTGSAQNLAPPLHGSELGFSRSLPPSPQHTPRSSRKSSLVGCPFAVEDTGDGNHLEVTLEKLISWPRDDQLVCLARETASQLYIHLEPKERERKIKRELDHLQARVEREGEIRVDLAQQEKEASERKDTVQRTRLALLISECDSRTQAIALLTMHFFTAQQNAEQQQHQKQLKNYKFELIIVILIKILDKFANWRLKIVNKLEKYDPLIFI